MVPIAVRLARGDKANRSLHGTTMIAMDGPGTQLQGDGLS